MSPDDEIQIRAGKGVYREGRLFLATACSGTSGHPVVLENYPGEDALIEGTQDVMGANWVSVGGGVYECNDANCQSTSGETLWTLWYKIGGSAEGQLVETNQVASSCTSALPEGQMWQVGAQGATAHLCIHLPGGVSPSDSSVGYLHVPRSHFFLLFDSDNVSNFTVRRNPQGGSLTIRRFMFYIFEIGSQAGVTLDGLTFGHVYDRCLSTASGPGGYRVTNNVVEYCGQEGIRIDSSTTPTLVENNEVRSVQVSSAFSPCGRGAYPGCRFSYDNCTPIRIAASQNVTVRGNVVHDSCGGGTGRARAIDLEFGASHVTVERNYVYSVLSDGSLGEENPQASAAYRVSAGSVAVPFSDVAIRNNRAFNVENCILFDAANQTLQGAEVSTIANNTCVNPKRRAITAETSGGTFSNAGFTFENNLLAKFSGSDRTLLVDIPSNVGSAFQASAFTYGAYYCAACGASDPLLSVVGKSANASVSSVQSFDASSQYGDPNLDTTGVPPTLMIRSPNGSAFDHGTPLTGFSDDFLGTSRPQGAAWDVGAHELIVAVDGGGMVDAGDLSAPADGAGSGDLSISTDAGLTGDAMIGEHRSDLASNDGAGAMDSSAGCGCHLGERTRPPLAGALALCAMAWVCRRRKR